MSEAPVRETPGERVRMLRKWAALSQAGLALRVDRSQVWVSQVERGEVELDLVSVVNSLARALHCHPREILGDPNLGQADERGLESAAEQTRLLRRLDLPPRTTAHRPLPELAEELTLLVDLRGRAAYAELGARSVLLFEELHAATFLRIRARPHEPDRARDLPGVVVRGASRRSATTRVLPQPWLGRSSLAALSPRRGRAGRTTPTRAWTRPRSRRGARKAWIHT